MISGASGRRLRLTVTEAEGRKGMGGRVGHSRPSCWMTCVKISCQELGHLCASVCRFISQECTPVVRVTLNFTD